MDGAMRVNVEQLVEECQNGFDNNPKIAKARRAEREALAWCHQAQRDRANGKITEAAEQFFLESKGEPTLKAATLAVHAAEQ
jgi:hypothetical protein